MVEAIGVILEGGLMVEAEEDHIIQEKKDNQEAVIHTAHIHPAVLRVAKDILAGQAVKARIVVEEAIQATEEAIVLKEGLGDLIYFNYSMIN